MSRFTIVILVIFAIGVMIAVWRFFATNSGIFFQTTSPDTIAVRKIPSIVSQLRQEARNGSWVAFAFIPPNSSNIGAPEINLQYSFEDGKAGLDWVLIAPRNLQDQKKFTDAVSERNQLAMEKEMNGVRYLRVEDGDIADLGLNLLQNTFGLKNDDEIEVIADGIDWRKFQ